MPEGELPQVNFGLLNMMTLRRYKKHYRLAETTSKTELVAVSNQAIKRDNGGIGQPSVFSDGLIEQPNRAIALIEHEGIILSSMRVSKRGGTWGH